MSDSDASDTTFWHSLQAMNLSRIIIAGLLLVYFSISDSKAGWSSGQMLYLQICIAYLMLALVFAGLPAYFRLRFLLQLSTQISVDILAISALYMVAGGVKSGLAILYLFPLAGVAILAPLVPALFFVSIVTLFLLAEGSYHALTLDGDTQLMQAGLYGAAFFAIIFVVNRLAARLIRQEHLADRRGRDLQIQQAINKLVIADMADGILVVDCDSTVLMGNPAAQQMLGVTVRGRKLAWRLRDIRSLAPIFEAFMAWSAAVEKSASVPPEASVFVFIKPTMQATSGVSTFGSGARRELFSHFNVRFAAVDTGNPKNDRTIIFLRDVSEIENQAQQLKLASMGRLTASIAHEVRNPLAAIAHASALLAEDAGDPVATRLLTIVADNVARVNRMIEDILNLSRKAQLHGAPFPLQPAVADIVAEFSETHHLPTGMITLTSGDAAVAVDAQRVRFDPMHLREVVVNLLSNAIRYASGQPSSIRLYVVCDDANRLELHVQDDGPGIAAPVRAHLFEPFHTTSSKGTGLGLYLARELCLNNGAMLDYAYYAGQHVDNVEQRDVQTLGRFVITFALPYPA